MVKLVDTLDSKSNVPWNVWVRVPPSVRLFMIKLDLHNKNYEEAHHIVQIFIENNIDNLPIEIITGNSIYMIKILKTAIERHGLRMVASHLNNLGSYIINYKIK